MTTSDLADALTFLHGRLCRLLSGERIQLPPGLSVDQVATAKRLKPALLVLLTEAQVDEAVERAAILEYEAGFTRADAEHLAGLTPEHRYLMAGTGRPSRAAGVGAIALPSTKDALDGEIRSLSAPP